MRRVFLAVAGSLLLVTPRVAAADWTSLRTEHFWYSATQVHARSRMWHSDSSCARFAHEDELRDSAKML